VVRRCFDIPVCLALIKGGVGYVWSLGTEGGEVGCALTSKVDEEGGGDRLVTLRARKLCRRMRRLPVAPRRRPRRGVRSRARRHSPPPPRGGRLKP
jgi:hypothetical protein